MRGLPDDFVKTGEYAPTTVYKGQVTQYSNVMSGGNVGFCGRDRSQPAVRVMSLTGPTLVLDGVIPNGAVGSWIRFNRVYDQAGNPVQGTFQITALANLGLTVTISPNPGQTVSVPSGTVRLDQIIFTLYSSYTPEKVVVRKVGKSTNSYRGRRSKRRT